MILIKSFFGMIDIVNTNIRGLDFGLLLALTALHEERSVTRAADRLALSQPAVSGILNRLRDLFEDELFIRTSHGVVPTPRAEALASQAKDVIRAAETLFEPDLFDPRHSTFEIRLCGTDYVNRALFGPLAKAVRRDAEKAQISISHIPSLGVGLAEALDAHDIVFTSHDPELPNPDGTLLFEDRLVCVSSHSNHKPGQGLSLREMCELPHIVGQRSLRSTVSERLTSELSKRGLVRNIALEVPDFATVFRMMQQCELMAFLPAKLVDQSEVAVKKLHIDLDIPAARVFARWHKRFETDPRHIWLRNAVNDVAKALSE